LTDKLSDQCNNPIVGGIVFADDFAHNPNRVDHIKYKIRLTTTNRHDRGSTDTWNTATIFSDQAVSGPRNEYEADGGEPGKKVDQ
jgi:hypothetical protein